MKNCCTDPGPEPRKISTAEVGRTLQTNIDGVDSVRATQLGGLRTLRDVKGASLAREQARLSGTLGAQHPRVAALSQKIATNATLAAQVTRAQSRSQASAPRADASTWIVHGHVRTSELKPVPQVTVALYTCEGQWLRQFGYACTDADGYFKLIVKSPGFETRTGFYGASAAPADGDFKATSPAGAPPPAAEMKTMQPSGARLSQDYGTGTGGRQACLTVTDDKQALLGGDRAPVTPRAGQVDYREIILDGAVCAPPPDGTPVPGTKTQFLGNSHNREVHDLKNTKKSCAIDRISADHRVFFRTADDAIKAGYDYCAYCFGKSKSRR